MSVRSVTHATFSVDRVYPHAPDKVFHACSDPAVKRRWFAEGEGWEIQEFTSDFRVGGQEVSRFNFRGGEPMRNDTTFLDIVPGERIIIAYSMMYAGQRISSSLATMEFRPEGAGTRMSFTEQGAYLDGHDDVAGREAGTHELYEALGRELDRLG
jgi:uncharacterized protein YndB with AHSA1/START domain